MRSISKKAKTFVSIATIAYGLILLYVLFFRSIGVTYPWGYIEYLKAMHNFIPFRSMYVLLTTPVISGQVIIRFIVNFFGNVILFIPWGFLLPVYYKKANSFKHFVVPTIITLFAVEAIQILTMLGSFDIEDVLLNMTGACFGFAGYRRYFLAKDKRDTVSYTHLTLPTTSRV